MQDISLYRVSLTKFDSNTMFTCTTCWSLYTQGFKDKLDRILTAVWVMVILPGILQLLAIPISCHKYNLLFCYDSFFTEFS